jgi:tetratricopeptide (TPR) repeat protein
MSSAQQDLAELAGRPDVAIDLPNGALLISALIQPGLDVRDHALEQVLTVGDAMLTLIPDSADELRDRGLIYRELGHLPAALADLARYIEIARDAQEIARIEPIVADLRATSMRVH